MCMRVAVTFIVKGPVSDHTLRHKVFFDKVPDTFDLLITCHFVRESYLDLSCELCIRTLLDLLHFVP